MKKLKGLKIAGSTLMGIVNKKHPFNDGNYPFILCDDNKTYKVTNISEEDLTFLLKNNYIDFPINMEMYDGVANECNVVDKRIPLNFYRRYPKGLFNSGVFELSSGKISHFKIDCDFLTGFDLKSIAKSYHHIIGNYKKAIGIPTNGDILAQYFNEYSNENSNTILIVDDVMTSGNTLKRKYYELKKEYPDLLAVAFVIFRRVPLNYQIGCHIDDNMYVHSMFDVNI